MTNWNDPQLTSTYTNFVDEVKQRDNDCAVMFKDGTSATNIPTDSVRWNASDNKFQKWTGSAWADLTSTYNFTDVNISGNVSFAGTLATTSGTFSSYVQATRFVVTGSTIASNGMYRPAANTLAFSTGSTKRATILSDGKFGIGLDSPGDKLDVNGSIRSRSVVKAASGSVTAPSFTFADDTNLGFYRVGENHIGVTCGNDTKFEVNSSVTKSNQQLSVNNDVFITGLHPRLTFNETGDNAVEKSFVFVQDGGNLSMRHGGTENGEYAFSINPGSKTANATDYSFDFRKSRVTMSQGLKVSGSFGDTQASEVVISGVSPQILFEDSDTGADDFYIHVQSNKFYILRDKEGVSGAWDTPYPLQLESDTDDAYIFGRRIIDNGEFSVDGNGTFSGTCTATSFSGSGANVNNLVGNNITSGSVAAARIAALSASKITSGTFNAARIPVLDASKIPDILKTTTSLSTNAELKIKIEKASATNGHVVLGIRQVTGLAVPTGFLRMGVGDQVNNTGGIADRNLFIGTDGELRISGAAANIGGTGGTVVNDNTSDIRLKTLLDTPVPGLSKIKELNPIRFTYKNALGERLGFSAQDVQPILPESVYDTNDPIPGEADDAPTMLAMRYTEMIPVLVNAVKELSTQVETLTARVAALEA